MFGRLRVSSCQLDQGGAELYQANFCSLCHTLRETSGYVSTLLTNYDSTFWLTVASGLHRTQTVTEKRACTALPIRRVSVEQHPPQVARSNAALLWLLAQAKAEDDIADEDSFKAKLFSRATAKKTEAARRYLVELGFEVNSILGVPARQSLAEQIAKPSFLQVSAPTADMLGSVFAFLGTVCERPDKTAALSRFGSHLGALIYLIDGLEDQAQDKKHGRFNPLLACSDALTSASGHLLALEQAFLELELRQPAHQVVQSGLRNLSRKLGPHLPAGHHWGRKRRQQAAFCSCCDRDKCRCSPTDCCQCPCDCCAEGACEGCSCDGCGCDGCDGCSGCDGCCDAGSCCDASCCDAGCCCPASFRPGPGFRSSLEILNIEADSGGVAPRLCTIVRVTRTLLATIALKIQSSERTAKPGPRPVHKTSISGQHTV